MNENSELLFLTGLFTVKPNWYKNAMKGRPEALENIAGKTFDVCVIGGGATGAG